MDPERGDKQVKVTADTVAQGLREVGVVPGDTVNLRLQDTRTHQLATIGFHYIGIVTEFPTAPKDSFFVANASYVAAHTGSDAVGAFLLDTGGRDSRAVAARVRAVVGTSAVVTDIGESGARIQLCDLPVVARTTAHGVHPGARITVRLDTADPARRLVGFSRIA